MKRTLIATLALALFAAGNTASANNVFVGIPGSNWNVAGNWSLGYAPDAGLADLHTSVNINGEVFVTDAQDGTSSNGVLCVGDAAAGGTTITLNNAASELTVNNGTLFGTDQQGANGPATLNLSNGTYYQNAGGFHLGHQHGSTVNQTGGQMLIDIGAAAGLTFNFAAAGETSTYKLHGGVLTTPLVNASNTVSTAILDFSGAGALRIGNASNGNSAWDYTDLTTITNLDVQVDGSGSHDASDFAFSQVTVGGAAYTQIQLIPTPAALPAGLTLIGLIAMRRRRGN